MSVYRKESNSLVPKAGLGIIDNIFNRFSNHAISNAKTTEALILRNVMYDESDGKLYKVGIDGTKGDEIKMDRDLDFSLAVDITTITTVSTDGKLIGSCNPPTSGGISTLKIRDKLVSSHFFSGANANGGDFNIAVTAGDTIAITGNIQGSFVPYK